MATNQPGAQAPKQQQAPQQTTVEWAQQNIAGSFADAGEAADKLRLAAQHCHLVGGASICPMIVGHEVQITIVPIIIADLYPIKAQEGSPAKKGIPKSTLMQLSAAAGVEWIYSKRQDDGSNPHFCHWRVVGRYRQIDGTMRTIEGDRDVDNRDGSDQIRGDSDIKIQMARVNTVRNAITKAKLRALREAFGVSSGMLETEVHKPFVFAKAIFTGRSSDPKVSRMFAAVIAQQQLAATAALYGGPMLGAPASVAGALPGPKGMSLDIDPEDDGVEVDEHGEVIDTPQPQPRPRATSAAAPSPPPPPPPAIVPTTQNGGARGAAANGAGTAPIFMPGKKGGPQTKITDAADKDLSYWCDRIAKSLDAGESRFPDRDGAILAAMQAEVTRRRGGTAPAADPRQRELPNGEPPDNYGRGGSDRDDDDIPY